MTTLQLATDPAAVRQTAAVFEVRVGDVLELLGAWRRVVDVEATGALRVLTTLPVDDEPVVPRHRGARPAHPRSADTFSHVFDVTQDVVRRRP